MPKKNRSSGAVMLVSDHRATGHGLARRRGRGDQLYMTPSEFAALGGDTTEDRARRRLTGQRDGGSTVYRCRRQLLPLWIAAAVYAGGALGALLLHWWPHLAAWAYGSAATAGAAAMLVGGYAAPPKWRVRAVLASAAGTVWLMLALRFGISWTTTGALLGATGLLAARWWQHHRPGYPTSAPRKAPQTGAITVPDSDDIPGMFARYIAGKGGILEGAYLTDREETDHALKWTVELVPGQQSISTVRTQMENFLSGLRRPQEAVIVEPHPSRDSAQLLLSVVTSSPITDTVPFDGPQYFHEGKHGWVEPAWYADGAGRVQVPVYAPNSARHVTVIGGQGSGKSALLNAMTVSLLASKHTTVWYLDGQDGGSSPQLMRYADWAPTGEDREKVILEALEPLFAKRVRRMKKERRSGLSPSPEFPGLIVIVDECHHFWRSDSRYLQRWIELARIARKLCVGFWAATQHPSLESFGGSDTLRSLLMQYTTLVLRTKGNVSKNILSMAQDPSTLPTMPGYGYVLSDDGVAREAPFRADFLDDDDPEDGTPVPADLWFEQYPCPPLHPSEQAALGDAYRDRVAIAEVKRRELDDEDDHLDVSIAQSNSSDEGSEADVLSRRLGPPRFPRLALVPTQRNDEPDSDEESGLCLPEGVTGQAGTVYRAIAEGASRRTDLEAATGLGKTRLYELLNTLRDTGHITKQGHGRWAVTHRQPEGGTDRYNTDQPCNIADDDHTACDAEPESRVLRSLRRHGVASAAEICVDTGINEPAVKAALTALRERGAVVGSASGTFTAATDNP